MMNKPVILTIWEADKDQKDHGLDLTENRDPFSKIRGTGRKKASRHSGSCGRMPA
jgi:hypothetical protein